MAKRGYFQKQKLSYELLTQEINLAKSGYNKVSKTTVYNHKSLSGIASGTGEKKWPAKVTPARLPTWLRQRRGFCKIYKCNDKELIMMEDEAFFGLERKYCLLKSEIYPEGWAQGRSHIPQGAAKRIAVYGALGLNFVAPLAVDQRGQQFSSATFLQTITPKVLPFFAAINGLTLCTDKAPFHTSEETTWEIDEVWKIKRFIMKGYWHDLNWMEKVWANLKDKVYKDGRKYEDKDTLEETVRTEWENLTSDFEWRRRLICCFEQACKSVLDNAGKYVHWA